MRLERIPEQETIELDQWRGPALQREPQARRRQKRTKCWRIIVEKVQALLEEAKRTKALSTDSQKKKYD